MSSPPDTKPTTWLEHVQKHDDSASLNKAHDAVADLFKVTTADKLIYDLRTNILEDIMALKVNALLCRFPIGDDMTLIH